MTSVLSDLKHGLRVLLRTPLFTVCTIAALAIGIGATTALFSVVHTLLIRPLPYQDAERLVVMWVQRSARSSVVRGENAGRVLAHTSVVRGIAVHEGARAIEVAVPAVAEGSIDRVVVLAQSATMEIVGVGVLELRGRGARSSRFPAPNGLHGSARDRCGECEDRRGS